MAFSGVAYDSTFEYLFVHPYASGLGNGFSWNDAFNTIEEAVNTITSGSLFIKHVDGSFIGATGLFLLSGIIEKIAIADNNTYTNENIVITSVDDNLSIIGGFTPPSPLPSSYIDLEPSGITTIVSGAGNFLHVTNSGNFSFQNMTLKNYGTGIFASGNFTEINDIQLDDCYNPIKLISNDVALNGVRAKSSTTYNYGIDLIRSTGTIIDTVASGYNIGIHCLSGNISFFSSNEISDCGTGVIFDNNETVTFGESLNGNLIKNTYLAARFNQTPFNGNYNTIYSTQGLDLIHSTGTYNNGIISNYNAVGESVILASSLLTIDNGCLYVPGYGTGNYIVDSESSLLLSGEILYGDPNFVQPESGDFRLDIRSICLGKADLIITDDYNHFPINSQAVKVEDNYAPKVIDEYKNKIRIINNSIVYINPVSGFKDDSVFVNITERKSITKNVNGISSFDIVSGNTNPYPYDYKIKRKFNTKRNEFDYYLVPYTVFEIKPVLDSISNDPEIVLDKIGRNNINVKTRYNYSNIVYDDQHGYDSTTNEVFYTLEKNNQYLIKSDMNRGTVLEKYYLAKPSPSGSDYKYFVYPSGLKPQGKVKNGYEFITDEFEGKNKVISSQRITCLNKEGAIKWEPTDINMGIQSGNIYRDIRGLSIFDGDLYYLTVKSYEDDMKYIRQPLPGYETEVIKVDLDNKTDIESIKSGTIININNPVSLTVNKFNEFVIASHDQNNSGNYFLDVYKPRYDYAIIDRLEDNTNRIYFREIYENGVDI